MTAPDAGTTLLLSDVHAHFHVVNAQVEHAEELLGGPVSQVVVLGDFGLFAPNLHDHFRRGGKRFLRPVSFIEGNHEDFRDFDALVRDYADVVTYLPRCSVQEIGPWRWLCVGGARYMDSWSTPPGCEIRDQDVDACLAHAPGSVDFVLSHDCPTGIGVENDAGLEHLGQPGVAGLSRVAGHLRPRWWFFGHHHRWHRSEHDGTCYLGLPQSWEGFVLMDTGGEPRRIEHTVKLPRRPGWWRWIGLK